MIRASIDIGSNSVLLLVANLLDDGQIEVLENHSNVTGLGRELDKNKKFIDISMDETYEVIRQYAEIVKKHGLVPEDILATGTEASRVARNATSFYQKIKLELGVNVRIITSEAEAYFSSKGILAGGPFDTETIVVMDIGGASTELMSVNTRVFKVLNSFSMPVGAVRLTQWYSDKQGDEKLEEVLSRYNGDIGKVQANKLYCVAGTMTSVGNMILGHKEFIENDVHGFNINRDQMENLFKNIQGKTVQELLKEFPFLGKRSKTICAGLKLAIAILQKLQVSQVEISTYGLRYGSLLEGKITQEQLVAL